MIPAARASGSGSVLYDGIIGFADAVPGPVRSLFAVYTKLGLLVLGFLCLLAWWRARATGEPRAVAVSLLGPAAAVVAYALSELVKVLVGQDRPCRGLIAGSTVLTCPEVGDWSFPSNHATIAGAAAMALVLAWRRLMPWVVALAVLMAFSRVFVGVHYPHDVLVGLALGAVVVWLVVRLLSTQAERLVTHLQRHRALGRLLAAAPGTTSPEVPTSSLTREPDDARRRPPSPAEEPTVRMRHHRHPEPPRHHGR
ncbi:undecaprenyl-diphosphatase [Saccharopolyspora kobensis]|uniref:Undecaprenyl-diphosphatase n=1 Tax=Saccharopolyspora kobensis TaxID=146035 RepID=A0A1H6ABA5_9PSEU|nr:phosphatase PAP2 family protein [Saccharopolyspora kobensis]SEG45731.1 undecaprenyl-diphosphatase [Saccharopolyspora kobensis]SFE53398.1 undecaprenyl-diphosphatase [Saccharopolyspora kobensis]